MSKRKPVPTTIEAATDSLLWRARVLAEIVDGFPQDARTAEPLKRLWYAIEDFEASRGIQTSSGPLFGQVIEQREKEVSALLARAGV